jgi:hypothetical protein
VIKRERFKCNFNCKHHIQDGKVTEKSCKYLQEHGECEKLNSKRKNSPIRK